MREILFRGKRIDNGEWVEGYYTKVKWYLDGKKKHIIFPLDVAIFPRAEVSEYVEVIPETVGQYTGLTDKNGKKIFEGDIVTNSCGRKKTVEFYDSRYYPFIAFPEYNCWDEKECEVIGNIHINPDLVGGAANV
jgi:uncharacterized phage protein (TIGR01671 family)